jgi:hypothetical protein
MRKESNVIDRRDRKFERRRLKKVIRFSEQNFGAAYLLYLPGRRTPSLCHWV